MATATARLDAPRLAGLVVAAIVVALASSARPDEAPTSRPTPTLASAPTPTPPPTPTLAPTPAPTPTPTPTPTLAPTPAPAPTPTAALAPTPTPESTQAPSTWTRLLRPRPLTIRGRLIGFTELGVTDSRLSGQRADGPFAPRGPTLVVHYASWCLPCAAELPEVLSLARSLADISTVKISASDDISKNKTSAQPATRAKPGRAPAIVFVSHDEAAGPQALLASFEDLLAKAHLTPADLPPGLSLRADPDSRFFLALTRARLPIPDPSALPSLWLLDHRARLHAHLGGPLTAAHRAPLLATLEALL